MNSSAINGLIRLVKSSVRFITDYVLNCFFNIGLIITITAPMRS